MHLPGLLAPLLAPLLGPALSSAGCIVALPVPLPIHPTHLMAALAWLPAGALLVMLLRLEHMLGRAPRLTPRPASPLVEAHPQQPVEPPVHSGWLRVVVPAYQESQNISGCVASVLASEDPGLPWQLLVVDDGSTDDTPALARQACLKAPSTMETHVLEAGPRPTSQRWCGKNWPASVGAEAPWPEGEPGDQWLLFLDADVRLAPAALVSAVEEAKRSSADLLSLAPRLSCTCLAEWLVQPIVVNFLGLEFPLQRTNDADDPTAFAAGPFMLFNRRAYEAIGGHAAMPSEVVEDLALARRIKASGYRLRYLLGLDLVHLSMYPDLAALWEGWTKNWYLGVDRNPVRAAGSAIVALLLYTVPWLMVVVGLLGRAAFVPLSNPLEAWFWPGMVAIGLQWFIRLWAQWRFLLPTRFWWLAWMGGLLIGAIVPVSVFRTITTRGWTWRGRPLG